MSNIRLGKKDKEEGTSNVNLRSKRQKKAQVTGNYKKFVIIVSNYKLKTIFSKT